MTLTMMEIRNAKAGLRDYKMADSHGLHLLVTCKGAKSWRFKYRFGGKEKRLTFGLFPEVGLKEARERRDEARALIRHGKDPLREIEKRRQAQIREAGATFKTVAEEWLADQRPLWSEANAIRVRHRIENDIYPALGKLPIADIDGPMVLRQLRKIEARGSIETAKRVKGYVLGIFKRAKAEHLITAADVMSISDIGDALKPTPVGSKQPALTRVSDLLELQLAIDRATCGPLTKLASRLLALTVVRVGVLRTAVWSEIEGIDWDEPDDRASGAIWRIPASRMKLEVEDKGNEAFGHEVPLSLQAIDTLRAVRVLTRHSDYIFPSKTAWRDPMSDAAISTLYKRMAGGRYKGKMVPHGWRSSFSTVMNERAADLEREGDRMIIDMMLAHVPPGMSASEWAYNRARYMKARSNLGQAWSDIISEGLPSPFTLLGQQIR